MAKIQLVERFLICRGQNIPLDKGYLPPANSHLMSGDAVASLVDLHQIRCLILLGESGSGKSSALEEEQHRLEALSRQPDGIHPPPPEIVRSELGDFSDYQELNDWLSSEVFKRWKEGQHHLFLLLDSVDEGRQSVPKLARILTKHLEKWPLDRLTLRLTCRPMDWPLSLEEYLKKLWGDVEGREINAVQAYELAPLRESDVADLARHNGIKDPTEFLEAVNESECTPFAANPLTLNFLLKQYLTHNTLPKRRVVLFERGCLELAKEWSPKRREENIAGKLNGMERLCIASRLAAITMLGAKTNYSLSFEPDEVTPEDVALVSIEGGSEISRMVFEDSTSSVPEREVEVGSNQIREVLGSGLFSSATNNALKWRHRSFAEFLTARYLIQRGLQGEDLLGAISHDGKVVPQLTGVATHLASADSQARTLLLISDPELVLRSDVKSISDSEREQLVEVILQALKDRRLSWRDLFERCHQLSHPRLPNQLHDFLLDKSHDADVRWAAFPLLSACKWSSIRQTLLTLTLDDSQPLQVRAEAAEEIAERGLDADKKQLLPFARLPLPVTGRDKDTNEAYKYMKDLKGSALQANWPDRLSAQKMFSLIEPVDDSGHSQYESFLSTHLIKSLQPQDLPVALQWVNAQTDVPGQKARRATFYIGRLCDEITQLAWDKIDCPGVASALAQLAIERFSHYRPLFTKGENYNF
ncbi:hypothetical protein B1R32_1012 [Abditibacterium utsteinense]|uniref:Uncharacterized protein n=1 Tax=Abditibacterium utsteinense TaxID=1960156 RepID=A0A2S8SWT9_9BACT|nr:hypothetical protein [Abditibacterium utsteinense]PQV65265.1 hypothetical protein B1R32_1012 [Abditibacterium utsteinense]